MSFFGRIKCVLNGDCSRGKVHDLGAGLELFICDSCLRPSYWLSIKEEEEINWKQEFARMGGPECKWDPILDIVKLKVGVG